MGYHVEDSRNASTSPSSKTTDSHLPLLLCMHLNFSDHLSSRSILINVLVVPIDSYGFVVGDFLSPKLAIICKREDISNKMLTSSKTGENNYQKQISIVRWIVFKRKQYRMVTRSRDPQNSGF